MKRLCYLLVLSMLLLSGVQAQQPLRVFIRGGVKTHGPNQHDHPRFLGDYTKLLGERGIAVAGGMEFPTAQQLEQTDVLVIYAADGMKIVGANRENFEKFLKRGGGFVVIHDGVVSGEEHEWAKKIQGGAWIWKDRKTKWLETEVGIYFVDQKHPITRGASNFDWKDEIYYEMDMAPDVRVLATSFHSVFVIAPQLWTYEKTLEGGTAPYRAFVSLPGHEYDVFNTPHYRAILLRGIAWAGKRSNADEFCRPEELASLKYPEGGPIAPEKASAKLGMHPEFNINLVTSEPLVEKVISLDWAPDGKLWVAETPEYPGGRTINKNDKMVALWNVENPGAVAAGDTDPREPKDRVSWLEDTDGDGRMDRRQVFAEGLELVTSVVFYKDGVIVAQAPEILWLRDTNGDGRCDMKGERVVLYSGFGTFDTHAVINNFRWGLDGWVYGAVGYSAGSPKSGVNGKEFGRITAGIIRFKPDGTALEQYASGSCNTWGFDFAPDGEAFYTTATCGEHFLHIVMPEKVLARGNVGGVRASFVAPDHQKINPAVNHTRPAYVQIDWVGMFTAAAGSTIYNGGAWPDRFTGSHFTSETTMSLVHHEFLTPQGVTYVARKEQGRENNEFIAGSDLWFRPIHARVGPDGALYVVDFYNQAAIHNDTRGPAHGARNAATRPDRDHHFTRVWRVQHKEARKIPAANLVSKNPGDWTAALGNPNGWVRETAARLLRESGASGQTAALVTLAKGSGQSPFSRIAALYTLESVGALDQATLASLITDGEPIVRKNALRVVANRNNEGSLPSPAVRQALKDSNPRARLNAFIALGTGDVNEEIAADVVSTWPSLEDKHTQSAAIGVASRNPLLFLAAAFRAQDPAFLADFVGHVGRGIANQQDAALAARTVQFIAGQPATTDALKQAVLERLSATLRAEVVPTWNAELRGAFQALLKSARAGLPGAALPLIARWDAAGELSADLRPVVGQLVKSLADEKLSEGDRGQVAANLVGVRRVDPSIIPAVASLLGSSAGTGLQRRVVDALATASEIEAANALIGAYTRVPVEIQEAVFGALVRRVEWAGAVLSALEQKKLTPANLGPSNLYRLRTHADKGVAARANSVIDALKGPEQKEKDALIAQFKDLVEQPGGNLENGKKHFIANCAGCHVYKDQGRNLAPNLTGMGAHGPADLLVHIVDPNRLVEPNFVSTTIETKDELTFDGVVERENNAELLLRNATADYTIRKDNIKSRSSTGRSLMPEGFEALGGEGLKDLLAYLCADERRYRILDLGGAFTANTSRGIYNSQDSREETLRFRKFGTIKVGDVPFDIISPAKSATGNNVIVLKGGAGIARSYPQQVEVKVGVPARRLHFLGGIGGWAFPCCGDNKNEGLPVAKVTVVYADGATEDLILKNGVEFADYIAKFDVPGSEEVPEMLQNGRQLRWFTKELKGKGMVQSLKIASYDNAVAPTFVGITADTSDTPPAAKPSAAAAPLEPLNFTPRPAAGLAGVRALLVGGGSSHDFHRWFNLADTATLKELGLASVNYTEDTKFRSLLPNLDVLCLSLNKPVPDPGTRKGLFEFADAGRGIVVLHAGMWANWPDWTEYNKVIAGGASRGHDRLGEFEVTVTNPEHPLMKGVPAKFNITDELYYFEPDPAGNPIEVLATAFSKQRNKTYPMVFVVKHPKTRIAAIALGHDGMAHSLPAYKTLLKNSVTWVTETR